MCLNTTLGLHNFTIHVTDLISPTNENSRNVIIMVVATLFLIRIPYLMCLRIRQQKDSIIVREGTRDYHHCK